MLVNERKTQGCGRKHHRDCSVWCADLNATYPSAYSCFSVDGTQGCHHRQSEESLACILPETVLMRVESYKEVEVSLKKVEENE